MLDAPHHSKTRLLDAALRVIKAKGYSATRIEDICEAAGLTKGSFFHHFRGKEDLALAAAEHWNAVAAGAFAGAPYRQIADPVDRLLGYVDFRKAILSDVLSDCSCFAGTVVQEVYETHPLLRAACGDSISRHAKVLEADVAAAMAAAGVAAAWTAESLALHIQAVIQGAFILAKASNGRTVALETLDHLRRYLEMLFDRAGRPPAESPEG